MLSKIPLPRLSELPWPSLRQTLQAAAFYLITAAAVAAVSLIMSGAPSEAGGILGSRFIGHAYSDLWKHVWGAWNMGEHIADWNFSTYTQLQNFPDGGKLYVIDPLNAMHTALWSKFTGLAAAYNITQIVQIFLSCMGAWLLACAVTGAPEASITAGLIYGLSPFMLTSGICSGICETTNLEWLPLSLLGLLLCFRCRPSFLLTAAAAFFLAMGAAGCWYYAIVSIVCTAIIALWTICTGTVPLYSDGKAAVPHDWFCPILACILSLVFISPGALLFADSLEGQGSMLAKVEVASRQQESTLEFFHKAGNFKNDASLAGYFLPGKSRISEAKDSDFRMKTTYIGLAAAGLAVIGLYCGGRTAVFWFIMGSSCLLISTGPYLNYYGQKSFSNPVNPLFWLAYNMIPGVKMAVIVDRFSIAVQLSAAVLAAIGTNKLMCIANRSNTGREISADADSGNDAGSGHTKLAVHLIPAFMCLLIAADLIFLSPVPFPLPSASASYSGSSEFLASEKDAYGLIQFPVNRTGGQLQPGEYYYWQTRHRRPMPILLTTRFSTLIADNVLTGTICLCEQDGYGDPPLIKSIYADAIEQLRSQGFGWICINGSLMGTKNAEKANRLLTFLLGEPRRFKDGSSLYSLRNNGISHAETAEQPKQISKETN